MFCPKCGAEYIEGFTQCHDCGVPLVERLVEAGPPSAPQSPDSRKPAVRDRPRDFVTVLRTGDPGLLGLVRSVLRSADIPFMTSGDAIQDLAGAGRMGTGFNVIFGPVEVQVRSEDAEDAAALLRDLETSIPETDDGPGDD